MTRDNLLSIVKNGMERHSLGITKLERVAGVPKDTVRDFLRGKAQVPRADKLQKILAVLQPSQKVAVIGTAGAGGFIEAKLPAKGAGPEEVDCPPGVQADKVFAIRIRGDALSPVMHDGWIVYYVAASNAEIPSLTGGWQVPYGKTEKKAGSKADPLSGLFGKPCVIMLKDGSMLLRMLRPGSRNKRYNLIGFDAPDVKDAQVKWVGKIIFIKT